MSLELDQAGAQSHSHPQRQAHPIPLYESDNYIWNVEGLQSLQWLLIYPWTSQHLIHCWNQLCDWPHNGSNKQNFAFIIFALLKCIIDLICVPAGGPQKIRAFITSVCKLQLYVARALGKPFMNSITIDRNQA